MKVDPIFVILVKFHDSNEALNSTQFLNMKLILVIFELVNGSDTGIDESF
jgi:hypothetical protein